LVCRRSSVRMRPRYEPMENRRLLASSTSSAIAGFLAPGAAEVARAATVMTSDAGPQFQKYENDLQRAEASSRVSPAQFQNLRIDGANLALAIQDSTNLAPSTITQQLVELQDVLDQSFLTGHAGTQMWARLQQELGNALYAVTFTSLT